MLRIVNYLEKNQKINNEGAEIVIKNISNEKKQKKIEAFYQKLDENTIKDEENTIKEEENTIKSEEKSNETKDKSLEKTEKNPIKEELLINAKNSFRKSLLKREPKTPTSNEFSEGFSKRKLK